ncbi:acyl-CoA dehydrogenase family protein [Embleya hyalina]|uniref:Acyl-CoA oxidase n=1 Tax=Embleya hyalina TaxID=516124 RepID=A0A401Z0X8_9ACTN|nr:acyl-CoA dehydrogenase [Embleya hyalina]GCE00499.1 acyl-CoA oxidase [Embleya hyalina]
MTEHARRTALGHAPLPPIEPAFPDPAKLFADVLFDPPAGPDAAIAGPVRDALTYRRVRWLHERISGEDPLLHHPAYLRELLELAAMVDPSVFHVMFLHHCMTLGPALDFGASPEDIAELALGPSIGAALMTEVGRGNSAAGIRTEAVWDPVGQVFDLHTPDAGACKYPPNVGLSGIPRVAVVGARIVVDGIGRGTGLFLVPLRDEAGPCPGVVITPRPPTGLLPLDYAAVRFDHVPVPAARWLRDGATITAPGERGGGHHDPLDPAARSRRSQGQSRFAWGAIATGMAAVTRAATAIALAHAHRRRTVGRFDPQTPALAHRNQQRALFGAHAAALTATVLARRATDLCWRLPVHRAADRGLPPTTMRTASLLKVTTDRLAEQAVSRCRRACGAFGFFTENRLIDYQGLAMAFNAAGGDNQLILLDAGWSMATGVDYEPPAVADAPGDAHARDDAETPAGADAPGRSTEPLERPGWADLFRTRERLLHEELVERLRLGAERGVDPFVLRNDCADAAERLGEAHAARITVEALIHDARATFAHRVAESVLDDLCLLRVLEEVAAHDGWFLAAGLLTADEVRGLSARIDTACARLAPHARALIELLDVPPGLVRGALVGDDPIGDPTR